MYGQYIFGKFPAAWTSPIHILTSQSTPASFRRHLLICRCRNYDDPYRNLSDLQANDRCPQMFLMKYMKWDPKLVNEAREHSENEMQPKKKHSCHTEMIIYKHWVQMWSIVLESKSRAVQPREELCLRDGGRKRGLADSMMLDLDGLCKCLHSKNA